MQPLTCCALVIVNNVLSVENYALFRRSIYFEGFGMELFLIAFENRLIGFPLNILLALRIVVAYRKINDRCLDSRSLQFLSGVLTIRYSVEYMTLYE